MKRGFLQLMLTVVTAGLPAFGGLIAYDNQIATDNASGLPYVVVGATPYVFDGNNNEVFDFGVTSGSVSIEFIVQGDPVAGGQNGFLAVGANSTFSLRYEQWNDTGVLGFTHGGVADYVFTSADAPPPVDNPLTNSPSELTHLAYRWDHTVETMELFVNGEITAKTEAPGFQFPSGAGVLGNNAGLTEGMFGTMERVAIYNDALAPTIIKSHADAWNGPGGSLAAYDLKVQEDDLSDVANYTVLSSTTLNFDTTNNELFDYGEISASATAEFIVQGDPVAGGQNGFLGVGSDPAFSLRFEQWSDTGKLGFTHGGVADYTFGSLDPPEQTSLNSPTELTHVVYRYDADLGQMELYLDGVLAGVNTAAPGFEMPTGSGFLGNNAALSEGMVGEIARVTVYDVLITPSKSSLMPMPGWVLMICVPCRSILWT